MKNQQTLLMQLVSAGTILFFLTATPAVSSAAGIVFHNNTKVPILVQGTSYFNGMAVRGPQLLIFPNQSAYDSKLTPGFRQICIFDGNVQNIKLLQKTINFPGYDVHYDITITAPVPGGIGKCDLTPTPPKKIN